jgi:glyoxylase-like metal-dependent hydrolase (beta-lactamase superfamily II)
MEVARGVYRLTQGVVNFYLVEEGGKLVVIDAGAPRDWDMLVRTVSDLGRELADIEAVLITHAHSDHVPGHTPGCTALLLETRGVLFTGDVLATRNPLTGRIGPQIMPSGLNRDTPQALRSIDVLDGIQADLLLPGHGEPWTGGTAEPARLARVAGPS